MIQWKHIKDDIEEMWTLELPLLDTRVYANSQGAWCATFEAINLSDENVRLKARTLETAQEEALAMARVLLVRYIEEIDGEPGELRFKQVIGMGGDLFGLSEDGTLYQSASTKVWRRCSMKRAP